VRHYDALISVVIRFPVLNPNIFLLWGPTFDSNIILTFGDVIKGSLASWSGVK